ncbi:hypothetical protein C8Q79DRAFT_975529 [Trametes meyenii]|nr:hypothetical protein C8Q79DRAFT_975529 [Trametes meyenii]
MVYQTNKQACSVGWRCAAAGQLDINPSTSTSRSATCDHDHDHNLICWLAVDCGRRHRNCWW